MYKLNIVNRYPTGDETKKHVSEKLSNEKSEYMFLIACVINPSSN